METWRHVNKKEKQSASSLYLQCTTCACLQTKKIELKFCLKRILTELTEKNILTPSAVTVVVLLHTQVMLLVMRQLWKSDCLGCTCCVALHCCLFDLACFFLPSFSPLIKICNMKSDCLGCAVLLCLVVCLTLLASFFLPSQLSLKHVHSHTRNTSPLCPNWAVSTWSVERGDATWR